MVSRAQSVSRIRSARTVRAMRPRFGCPGASDSANFIVCSSKALGRQGRSERIHHGFHRTGLGVEKAWSRTGPHSAGLGW
jgi:hypothetical protein